MRGSNNTTGIILIFVLFCGAFGDGQNDDFGDAQYDNCTGWVDDIANGFCSMGIFTNNNEECGYDGGDCCECTCKDGREYPCGYNGFSCIDPSSGCIDPIAAEFPNCKTEIIGEIADGKCDSSLNNKDCGYDGGDCCECTCTDGSSYSCQDNDWLCLDPTSDCFDSRLAQYINCTGDLAEFADGYCQDYNNNAGCGYDGGDCCECTSVGNAGYSRDEYDMLFDCLDPNASSALYNCEEPQAPALPCALDLPRHWSVITTAEAHDLAQSLYCAGGSFDVEWLGVIAVNTTIHVVNGIVLNITGVGSSATMDGGGTVRLFTVANASLLLTNMNISYGNAISGGSIAASRSILTLIKTVFVGNTADTNGGALVVSDSSKVTFDRETYFLNNSADSGSALYVTEGSDVSWAGDTIFAGNAAKRGGALAVVDRSTVLWKGSTSFSGNVASSLGGGLWITGSSTASWSGNMDFASNNANGGRGGALYVSGNSVSSWTGTTTFSHNEARLDGGAVYATDSSAVSWSTMTAFSNNTSSRGGGGAFHSSGRCNISWSGETTFANNTARHGGALHLIQSTVFWSGETGFLANNVETDGGGLIGHGSTIFWSANTVFSYNTANNGGAAYIVGGSRVEWINETTFSCNKATSTGGAVGSEIPSIAGDSISRLFINGTTRFVNNTSGENGGGMALRGMLLVEFETMSISFVANSARVSGGGIFMLNAVVGPMMRGISFIGNTAQVGGAVYATGSGTTIASTEESYATTFDGCSFIDNVAETSGGAISSGLGQDKLINTLFVGNRANVGGALQLAGTASLDNCSFRDNVSGVGGAPAMSNIGSISGISNSSFIHNVLSCDQGAFLTFIESLDYVEAVCVGCPDDCERCYFDKRGPLCVSLSEAGVEHAESPGGVITVEELVIDEGYWRASNTSTNVLECYNKEACAGGLGNGNCNLGYEGPYCSICSKTFVGSLSFTCKKCSHKISGIVIAAIVALMCLAVGVAAVLHIVSGETNEMRTGVMGYIIRIIPLQAMKITIVFWQILTQFASVTSVTFPGVYQTFLDSMDFLNFDLGWMLSTGCVIDVDFHDRMLISTIGPLVVTILLGVTYAFAVTRNRGSEGSLRLVQHKHMSAVISLIFLVYSSVSSVVFQMFDCDNLDDGNRYLRADYSILCDSDKHRTLQIYTGIMIVVYPMGIPALYSWLLFRDRKKLTDGARRENDANVRSTSTLWDPYKPSRFYYEVVECIRRVLLTGTVLVVDDDTAAKIAATSMIAVMFMVVSEVLAPYESKVDAWVSRAGHAVVYMTMFFALLLKVDISNERQASQMAFESILVTTHALIIFAVVGETIFVAWSSLKPKERFEPNPRFRVSVMPFSKRKDAPLNDFGEVMCHVREGPHVSVRRERGYKSA